MIGALFWHLEVKQKLRGRPRRSVTLDGRRAIGLVCITLGLTARTVNWFAATLIRVSTTLLSVRSVLRRTVGCDAAEISLERMLIPFCCP